MMKKPWQIWSVFGLILLVVLPAMVWLTMQINETDRLREEDRQETELARRQAELQERINSALYRMDFWATPLVAQEAARPYYLYEPFFQIGTNNLVGGGAEFVQPPAPVAGSQRSAPPRIPVQSFSPPNLPAPNLPLQTAQTRGASRQSNQPALPQALSAIPQGSSQRNTFQNPSPLLFGTSEYVIMHFQITPENEVTSPQRPEGDGQTAAMTICNIPEDTILDNGATLNLACQFCDYETIAFQCPTLPPTTLKSDANLLNQQLAQAETGQFQTVYHDLEFERFSNSWDKAEDIFASVPQKVEQKTKGSKFQNGSKFQKGSKFGKGGKLEQQSNRNSERGNREYSQRAQTAALNANTQYENQNQIFGYSGFNRLAIGPNGPDSNNLNTIPNGLVREGVMRPIWLDGRLMLARRVEGADKKIVQCCWLDWEKIQAELKEEVADLLPECELQPVKEKQELRLARAMATLPVQLVVNSDKLLSTLALSSNPQITARPSALKLSMMVAWIGLGIGTFASALLLRGVLKLSERRAAFVSAVTHELRTPLTTFRMYSEMLAEKMVPDEKRGEYAETMKHEADRLSNLVENVLQFAKLERGTGASRIESLNVLDLIGRFEDRLHHRASTMGMDFSIDLGETTKTVVSTDPGKVEQIVFNLVDNACKYAAHSDNNQVTMVVQQAADNITISVRDYGPGVATKFRKLLFKPFCKSDQDAADTASGVGLGLALCQQMAKSIGGKVSLVDCDKGAKFVLSFPAK